jgi:hypothetical protein
MDPIPPTNPELERAQAHLSAAREQLENHRARPLSTPEWKDQEQSLLKELTEAEGALAKLTAERGIVDA